MQLRIWLRDIDPYTPATERQDEVGDLARQLRTSFAPPVPEPVPEPEAEYTEEELDEDDEDAAVETLQVKNRNSREPGFDEAPKPRLPAPPIQRRLVAEEDEEDEGDDPFADLRDTSSSPAVVSKAVAPSTPQPSAVLAVQLGSQDQLRRLPRARLTDLLQRYRDCLDQASSLYEGELHTLNDGSTLLLFHSQESGDDYLTNAICCGELLRALSHALQIEVADSGITLQLQLGLTLGEGLAGMSQIDLLLTETAQDALALSQHSRNLLLVERKINDDALIRQRARIRPIASPEGACCVERLMEPYPSMLERQLARMHETARKV
jgi:hypothetical protein